MTKNSRQGSDRFTHYIYRVSGKTYDWSVSYHKLTKPRGNRINLCYLPEHPGTNILGTDPSPAAKKAQENRNFARKAVLGVALFFAFFAFSAHRSLMRKEAGMPSELDDPAAYKQRITYTMLGMAAMVMGVSFLHGLDAHAKGQSLLPVVLGAGIGLVLVVGTLSYASGAGPKGYGERAKKLFRWLIPLKIVVFLLLLARWLWLR